MSHWLRLWFLAIVLHTGLVLQVHAEAGPAYPSPMQTWSARQYSDFHFVHFNTHLALPHLRDARSRALFERLVGRGNIEAIIAADAPRGVRQRDIRSILAAIGAIRGSYNVAVMLGEPLQEELTQVQIFSLYLASEIAGLSDGSIAGAACASSVRTSYLGVIQSLTEQDTYTSSQIAALSDAAARSFPAIEALFEDPGRRQLANRIGLLSARQTDADLRLALHRLRLTIAPQ